MKSKNHSLDNWRAAMQDLVEAQKYVPGKLFFDIAPELMCPLCYNKIKKLSDTP